MALQTIYHVYTAEDSYDEFQTDEALARNAYDRFIDQGFNEVHLHQETEDTETGDIADENCLRNSLHE